MKKILLCSLLILTSFSALSREEDEVLRRHDIPVTKTVDINGKKICKADFGYLGQGVALGMTPLYSAVNGIFVISDTVRLDLITLSDLVGIDFDIFDTERDPFYYTKYGAEGMQEVFGLIATGELLVNCKLHENEDITQIGAISNTDLMKETTRFPVEKSSQVNLVSSTVE